MDQHTLSFPRRDDSLWADFIESSENTQALTILKQWPDWPSNGLILYGPPFSGKSHLARIWAHYAYVIKPCDMEKPPRDLPYRCFILDHSISTMQSQIWLFDLLNILRECNGYILIISREPVSMMNLQLNDLVSRLSKFIAVEVQQPQEELLQKIIIKLAHSAQTSLSEDTIQYILTRTQRDIPSLKRTFSLLNEISLSMQRPITVQFIRKLIDSNMFAFENESELPSSN